MNRSIVSWIGMLCLLAGSVQAADWYVATNGNDSADGTTWPTAKLTIQAGIDVSSGGDTVWVSNGVYDTGGRVVSESFLTNRVVIDKPIHVRSINGPVVSVIKGAWDPVSTNNGLGDAGVRCVYVGTNAVLSGFTLTNGATRTKIYTDGRERRGGGATCEPGSILNNCVMIGNSSDYGGGAFGGTLNGCMLIGNWASVGGGANSSTMNNCTVSSNRANIGGGVDHCTLTNSIVYYNSASPGGNAYLSTLNYCCIPDVSGIGNISSDPQFMDAVAGNYRLGPQSPCINAGDNSTVQGYTDLDGNPRIAFGRVDMGAYEGITELGIWPVITNLTFEGKSENSIEVWASVPWTASTNVAWLSITSSETGVTNGQVVYEVEPYYGATIRTGAVILASGELTRTCMVVQTGRVLYIDPSNFTFPGEGASGTAVAVTANLPWSTTTNVPWLSVTSGGSGTTNGTVLFSAASNPGDIRTGAVVFVGAGLVHTCTVIQTPVLAITPEWINLPSGPVAGSNIDVAVNAPWTAVSDVPWLVITSGDSGTAHGTVIFNVTTNGNELSRSGSVTVACSGISRTCMVWQAEGSPERTEWFVATNGNDASDGTTWPTAKLTIQAGVDAAASNDMVWVDDGTYHEQLSVSKAIRVQSMNGAEQTILSAGGAGRCVYMNHAEAVISGFTLTGGNIADYGAGARIVVGTLEWCKIINNKSTGKIVWYTDYWGTTYRHECRAFGGGVYGGTLKNCLIKGNVAESFATSLAYSHGAGAYFSTLENCVVVSNTAKSYAMGWNGGGSSSARGGGVYGSYVRNCTVVRNLVWADGPVTKSAAAGGADSSTIYNSIAYNNLSSLYNNPSGFLSPDWPMDLEASGLTGCASVYTCSIGIPTTSGNITNDPQFVDAEAGDYHLKEISPCLDAGDNSYVLGTMDLDGNPRIMLGMVDMGAYEVQMIGYSAWASSITNGLTNETESAAGDDVPNLLKYATGSSPMETDGGYEIDSIWSNEVPVLVLNRNPNAIDIMLTIEGSDAMVDGAVWRGLATNLNGSWGGATNVSESESGDPVVVTVEDTLPLLTNRFLRLKVTRP